ncbi:hypothetical protein [Bacillus infantis]|uniref:hypothetical protein n=1 Tax=Bacillus infantis TaxID=324767 RepID=UPI003CE70A56
MGKLETQKVIVGHFLDVMKYATAESRKYSEVGIEIEAFDRLANKAWASIKFIIGMPEEEEVGVFVSDYWLDFAFYYDEGRISKEEVVDRIVDWKSVKD